MSGRQHRDNPMNRHLRPDYLDPFVDVARLICPVDPPAWLAEQLWRWNKWLYRDRVVEESRPSRAQMRKTLLEVEEALSAVTEALASAWIREFLDVSSNGPLADPERLIVALEDLQDRATRGRGNLATKAGATRPGPGKARPEEMSPYTLCAIIIWEAWKHVHEAEPKPKSRRAWEAAEAYWRAAGGEGHHFGKEPLAIWRHHFKKADASRAEDFRTEWRRHLNEAERRWTRRNSVSNAA
jgi:hypothetical protein